MFNKSKSFFKREKQLTYQFFTSNIRISQTFKLPSRRIEPKTKKVQQQVGLENGKALFVPSYWDG
jgi:hypothetical protein